jgi:phosphatidylglycerol---prolipoprotein diacylglyceryl transferase
MFDLTPDPIAFTIGPFPVHWYGLAYAAGLVAVYLLLSRLAKRAGKDPEIVNTGIIIIAAAALIGGRLYHVIDRWDLYQDNLVAIVMPPYSGLGVYGGIVTGTLAAWVYLRRRREPFWEWADIVAPGLFLMQAIGRWGNFFNQELFGPPTTLPWGIPIDCAHRIEQISQYTCEAFPEATRFHPLFLYESLSGFLGMFVLLWLGARHRRRLRPGDLLLIFFIWYGTTRFLLEFLRENNWTLGGVPTAQIVSAGFIVVGVIGLIWRHRSGRGEEAENGDGATDAVEAEADEDSRAPGMASDAAPPA